MYFTAARVGNETLDGNIVRCAAVGKNFLAHQPLFDFARAEKFYSTIYIWDATSREFVCYYINFQLPFRRTPLGFDTLDLDLDLVIDPSFTWEWKDEVEYQQGIHAGGIRREWVREVERAQPEVFKRIEQQAYPLNGSWLNFQPDPNWSLPYLPKNWDEVNF